MIDVINVFLGTTTRIDDEVDPMIKGRYVDDISGGADSTDQLLSIVQQLTNLCQSM